MIPIEKLLAVTHIVTHKDCADGMASAMILKDVLPGAKVSFIHYSSPEHKALVAEKGMLFCDFSPYIERPVLAVVPTDEQLKAFVEADKRAKEFIAADTLVLDHHKFAKETVEAFGENGIFADEATEPGVCGAVLAYRHVWLPLQEASSPSPGLGSLKPQPLVEAIVRDLATLAGIRDTWQKQDHQWQAACEQAESLRWWPEEHLVGSPPTSWPGLIQPIGGILFAKNLKYAKQLSETSYRFVSKKGTRVLIFGGVSMSSDTAEQAGDTADLVVGFSYKCDDGKPVVIFSTRTRGNEFNCGEFCVAHGGGGHTKAAGFTLPLNLDMDRNPFQQFREILEAYENRMKTDHG